MKGQQKQQQQQGYLHPEATGQAALTSFFRFLATAWVLATSGDFLTSVTAMAAVIHFISSET
jgi:hypothetical protein